MNMCCKQSETYQHAYTLGRQERCCTVLEYAANGSPKATSIDTWQERSIEETACPTTGAQRHCNLLPAPCQTDCLNPHTFLLGTSACCRLFAAPCASLVIQGHLQKLNPALQMWLCTSCSLVPSWSQHEPLGPSSALANLPPQGILDQECGEGAASLHTSDTWPPVPRCTRDSLQAPYPYHLYALSQADEHALQYRIPS